MSVDDRDQLPDQEPLASFPASPESEIQEYLEVREQRRRVFPRAALVGLGAGLTAVLFRTTLAGMDALRNALIGWAKGFPAWGWILPILFSALGATASVLLVSRYAPETRGSGVPHLKAVLHRFRTLEWRRVLPVKFLAGVAAIGGGLTLGREGPTVQMGGAIGDAVSRWVKSSPRERRTLIAAGAGAGLAAAFNAPLLGSHLRSGGSPPGLPSNGLRGGLYRRRDCRHPGPASLWRISCLHCTQLPHSTRCVVARVCPSGDSRWPPRGCLQSRPPWHARSFREGPRSLEHRAGGCCWRRGWTSRLVRSFACGQRAQPRRAGPRRAVDARGYSTPFRRPVLPHNIQLRHRRFGRHLCAFARAGRVDRDSQ